MYSKLKKEEFKKRLIESTRNGNPLKKGSPISLMTSMNQSSQPFYGQIGKSDFAVTKNSTLFPIPYILKGNFKSAKGSQTEIDIKTQRIWFGYLWIRILPTGLLIAFNWISFSNNAFLPKDAVIAVNIVLLIMLLPIMFTIRQKFKLISKLKTILEIDYK